MDIMNQNNPNELDEMRKQFALLQERLDRQVEINDKQMHKALNQRLGQMKDRDRMAVVVCLLGWIVAELGLYSLGVSTAFQVFVNVCMAINLYCSVKYKLHANDFRTDGLASTDLVQTTRELLRYKRFNQNYLWYVSIPFIIIFVLWFSYEQLQLTDADTLREYIFFLVPGLVGCIIGGSIGLTKFYFPSMRQANEMLAQIEELQAD